MRTTVSFLSFLMICFIFLPGLVIAADYDFSLGTGYLTGDSTYQIGGHIDDVNLGPADIHFPLSELMFPLDAVMLQAKFGIDFTDRWRFSISGQTNLTSDTGKMEDSDWLSPGSLDIYSESDTEMRALLFDGKLRYTFYQGYYGQTSANSTKGGSDLLFAYSAGLGYKHQLFDFEVSNVDQWYPSSPSTPHDRVSGLVLTYDVEYWIPYLELAMDISKSDKFSFELGFAYAPVINVKDEDHHLLRNKVNVADHDWNGSAHFFTVKGRYNFNDRWYMTAEIEKMRIESEGRSDASFFGVYDHSIDHKIESNQLSGFLTVGYSF